MLSDAQVVFSCFQMPKLFPVVFGCFQLFSDAQVIFSCFQLFSDVFICPSYFQLFSDASLRILVNCMKMFEIGSLCEEFGLAVQTMLVVFSFQVQFEI
jgi:hypothetical protein